MSEIVIRWQRTQGGVAHNTGSAVMESYTAVVAVKRNMGNAIFPNQKIDRLELSSVVAVTKVMGRIRKELIAVLETAAQKMGNVVRVKIIVMMDAKPSSVSALPQTRLPAAAALSMARRNAQRNNVAPSMGEGKEFCSVPDKCLGDYGRCDSDIQPMDMAYFNSSADDRTHRGEIPYGQMIRHCSIPRLLGLSYDDGPSDNTDELLDLLRDNNVRATFFVTGVSNGKGAIDQTDKWQRIIRRMVDEEHQVASHTWSHQSLDNISSAERWTEMVKNEQALFNIIGKYSNYVRPPYVQCTESSGCLQDLGNLGYHVIGWSIDSSDYRHEDDLDAMIEEFDRAFDALDPEVDSAIIIQHDTIHESAIDLTKHILARAEERTFFPVPISQCLGDEPEDSYRVAVKTEIRNDTIPRDSDTPSGTESSASRIAPFLLSQYLLSFVSNARLSNAAPVVRSPIKPKGEL